MDECTPMYLDLPPEAQQLLADNNITIQDILSQENIQAEVKSGVMPAQEGVGTRSKEVVTILLASGFLAITAAMAIARVLEQLQRKPYHVDYYELVPLKDAQGNILLDKEGKPVLLRQKRHDLLEPRKTDHQGGVEISFDLKNGLIIKFNTADEQINKSEKTG